MRLAIGNPGTREGTCVLMLAILELAQLAAPRPLGEWSWRFTSDPRWRVSVNGGSLDLWYTRGLAIPRGYAVLEFDGRTVASCDVRGGHTNIDESTAIAAVQRESNWVKR